MVKSNYGEETPEEIHQSRLASAGENVTTPARPICAQNMPQTTPLRKRRHSSQPLCRKRLCGNASMKVAVCSNLKDRDLLIKELREKAKVFHKTPGRCHPSFPNFICNPIRKLDRTELDMWLIQCAKDRGYKLLNSELQ